MARNPFVQHKGLADPHVHVWGNGSTAYCFATHDFSPNNTGFRMDDWWVWQSNDLVTWTQTSVLKPRKTPAAKSDWESCWATDAAERDGSYYWYLSIGSRNIAVMTASTPHGPWHDPLGRPLVAKSDVPKNTTARDPGVFHDVGASGDYFLIFGSDIYYIARLARNMTALAETPRPVVIHNAIGPHGPSTNTGDKPFLHEWNGTYYLSWGSFYGTGASPYGPFDYRGSVITTAALAPNFRMNETGSASTNSTDWWASEDLKDRHGSFFSMHGQWYFATNDRTHSDDKLHPGGFRDSVMGYVHYYSNGSIAPVHIDAQGVGEHSLAPAHGAAPIAIVQAEEFSSIEGNITKTEKAHELQQFGDGGSDKNENTFQVSASADGSSLLFKNVHSAPAEGCDIALRVACASDGGGDGSGGSDTSVTGRVVLATIIDVRSGTKLGRCELASTGSQHTRTTVNCGRVPAAMSTMDVKIVFTGATGGAAEAVQLDYWQCSALHN